MRRVPDIMSVRMQDILYSRKPELREQISRRHFYLKQLETYVSSGVTAAAYSCNRKNERI